MRTGEVVSKGVARRPTARGRDLAVGGSLADGDGSVVATETEAAGDAQRRLSVAHLMVGGAYVRGIARFGELLVPQRSYAAQPAVGCVTILTSEITRGNVDRRSAARRQIVHTQHIRRRLLRERDSQRQEHKAGHPEEELHGLPPAACLGKP